MQIKIFAINAEEEVIRKTTLVLDSACSYAQVMDNDALKCFIEGVRNGSSLTSQDMVDRFVYLNDTKLADSLKKYVLEGMVEENDVLGIDATGFESVSEDVEEEEDSGDQGLPGHAFVVTSAGLRTTQVDIVCGVTTVKDAITSRAVITNTGAPQEGDGRAYMLAGTSVLNGRDLLASEVESEVLHNGDTISWTPKAGHTKGC